MIVWRASEGGGSAYVPPGPRFKCTAYMPVEDDDDPPEVCSVSFEMCQCGGVPVLVLVRV